MGKPDAPDPPDYGPVAEASKEAAKYNYKLGRKQLEWAKEQYRTDKAMYKNVINSFLGDMETTSETAAEDRRFYEQNFRPLEKDLAREAEDYDTRARREREMGKAEGAVAEQFESARQNAQKELEAYGIDPSSTRYGALDIGLRAQQAAAQAAAGTLASNRVEDTGRALRAEAINVGRGYPGQIAQSYGVSGNMGSGVGNLTGQATTIGGQTMGTAPQYQSLGNQSLGTWGNTLHMGYQDQLAQFNANQQASSGWGSALGLAGGIAGKAFGLFEEGGVVPEGDAMAGDGQYGGAIPEEMSPSGGEMTDDVPARLNEGEFVIPDDVVSWFGEKHFYGLIDKTAKERQEAKQRTGAIPEEGMGPIEEPQYQSA